MHVGIITYQTGHLKTYQMIQKYLAKSYKISIFAFPFTPRPHTPRKFEERPYQIIPVDMPAFCKANDVNWYEMPGWGVESAQIINALMDKPDIFVTVIAKIIPQHFIKGNTILNCHPGILPDNRGVDAFKWAILNKESAGVSLHVIDENIDAGVLLKVLKIPILKDDSYEFFCQRAYDIECELLASFAHYLDNNRVENKVDTSFPLSRKSIPEKDNAVFDQVFENYKLAVCQT